MTDTKHTPGPWSVDADGNVVTRLNVGDDDGIIALANRHVAFVDSDTCRANAALIAAAPDLLAACERLTKLVEELAGHLAFIGSEAEGCAYTYEDAYNILKDNLLKDGADEKAAADKSKVALAEVAVVIAKAKGGV